jgi:biotin carboxyl carrier protein
VKLQININNKELEADFSAAENQVVLTIDKQRHEARISEPETGLYTVIMGDRVYRCSPEMLPNGQMEIVVNGQRFPVAVRDPRKVRSQAGAEGSADGKATLIAPMPGKVVRLLKSAGDEIAAGQGVMVVEAMKMQNEVQSPKTGKVVEIKVTEGQTVNAGETLAIVE